MFGGGIPTKPSGHCVLRQEGEALVFQEDKARGFRTRSSLHFGEALDRSFPWVSLAETTHRVASWKGRRHFRRLLGVAVACGLGLEGSLA